MSRKHVINSPFCELLGIEVAEYQTGRCKITMPADKRLYNRAEMVHGGATYTLGDVAMGYVAAQDGAYSLTKSVSVEYLAPARGETLSAIGTIVRQEGNRVYTRAEIYSDELLVSTMTGEFRIKKQSPTTSTGGQA